jgi:ketosteroid isomerase-like protein
MPRESIQVVRDVLAAVAAADVDALLELYDPEIVFQPLTGTVDKSGGYHGHEGVRRYFEEIEPVWREMRPYADDYRQFDDRVVAVGGCLVKGRESGAETTTPMAWVFTVRDGLIVSSRAYRTVEEALETVGVTTP